MNLHGCLDVNSEIYLPDVFLFYSYYFFCAGNALLRKLVRIGVLDEGRMKLDYVLGLKIEDFLERRLQTQVWCNVRLS